jgi:prophage DNA circulation protein
MKLYEIANEYRELLAMVEDGELSADDIADTLEAMDASFEHKARNCLMVMKELEAAAAGAKAEAERLSALASSRKTQAEKLKEYVAANMQSTNKDKMDLGIFALTLKKAAKVVDVKDETKIPKAYFVEVPATEKLDKASLLAALKAGPVDGADLKDGKRALIIK